MKKEEYQRLFSLEKSYWWFVGTKKIVLEFSLEALKATPGKKVLDVGCGSGIMMDQLKSEAEMIGMDFEEEALRFCKSKGHSLLCMADAASLPFKDEEFDLILAIDLLEHCPEDIQVLKELFRACKRGGKVVLSVPAFPFLFSHHDVALHHHRRYTRKTLAQRIAQGGFKLERATYFNTFLFFPIALWRLVDKLFPKEVEDARADYPPLPGVMNQGLIAILSLERLMLRKIPMPIGLSLLAILSKPKGGKPLSFKERKRFPPFGGSAPKPPLGGTSSPQTSEFRGWLCRQGLNLACKARL